MHMKNILISNNTLIDEYGNVNLNALRVIKKIEQYIDIKEELNDQLNQGKKEINSLIQSGGNISSMNKKYMAYNDYDFFTTKTFQKVLDEINA